MTAAQKTMAVESVKGTVAMVLEAMLENEEAISARLIEDMVRACLNGSDDEKLVMDIVTSLFVEYV